MMLAGYLRAALRAAWRSPGFTVIAVATLGLGIGATSTIFSLVNAVFFRSSVVAAPDRLVDIYTRENDNPYSTSSYPDYLDLRAGSTVFDGVLHYRLNSMMLTGHEGRQVLWTEIVSGNYFAVLGIVPAVGRFFTPEEDVPGAPATVVLSHQFWQRHFGGDPAIVGQPIPLNGQPFIVVGVAPKAFAGMVPGLVPSIWVPVASTERTYGSSAIVSGRANRGGWNKARLRPGATVEAARVEVSRLGADLARAWPASNAGRDFAVVASSSVTVHPSVDGMLSAGAAVLLAIPALVLVIVCANLATLLLARAAGRRRELAVRLALGATRGELTRFLLAEQLLLAMIGGAVGLLLAAWLGRLLVAYQPPIPVPLTLDLSLDARVIGFTLGVALLTGLAVGLLPALRGVRADLVPDLREGGGGGRQGGRIRRALVAGQLALSMLLVLGAGLLLRSVTRAGAIDRGFDGATGAVVAFDMQQAGVDAERGATFFQRFEAGARSLPGVRAVAWATRLPLQLNYEATSVLPSGRDLPPDAPVWSVPVAWVSPEYFDAIGARMIRGRAFAPTDSPESPPVAIVNDVLAAQFWPGQDAVGQTIQRSIDGPRLTVVGVARGTRVATLGEEPRPQVYFAATQRYLPSRYYVVAGNGDPASLLPALRTLAREVDPGVTPLEFTTLPAHLDVALFPLRFVAGLLTVLGAIGLFIAALGLYGVIAEGVAQRRRELGIRMALGADGGRVVRLVLREGLAVTLAGLGIGLVLAAGATRALQGWLYGISATDPVTFLSVAIGFALVATLACWVPARRATRVDPIVALRAE